MTATPAARTLTERELNRALLARQLLLERTSASLPRVLERIGGIQAQYAPSMYIGLWSRVEGFERDHLTRALERHSVVQATLMRATIHLVSRGDYWPMALAVRDARREQWLRSPRGKIPPAELDAAAKRLRRALADRPLAAKELEQVVKRGPVSGAAWRNAVGLWLDLVRVPPSGTWERRRADLYGAAEQWLGPPSATEEEGVELLVRRYLGGFGPASPAEIANWAGLPKDVIERSLGGLRLRRFESEAGAELVDLPRARVPDPETPAPVRFLPTWDATLLAHARRTGILAEEHRPRVFNVKTPQSTATFLVDGRVAGTWRYEKGRVITEPFGRLDRATQRELRAEAERLSELHG